MPKEFQNTKNSIRKKKTTNKQEMDSSRNITIRIVSGLESIERNRRIDFLLKGSDLTIDYLNISDDSFGIGFVTGEVRSIDIPQAIRELTIDGIISGLKSRKIQSNKEYNFREFDKTYLKKLWDKEVTASSQELKEMIDENVQINQLGGSTTEGVVHEVQEDSEYVTMESAPLKEQEPELFDFASSKATTQEINDVINEIEESNASDGITPEDISRFGHNSKEVLDHSIFNSTDVEGPKLPEINGGQYIGIAGIAGGILGMLVLGAVGGLGYLIWHRKNREGSYDVEKAQRSNGETESLSENKERESLLSRVSNATSVAHLSSQISTER